jgi:CheY-like chemotaxis protein
VLLAVRDSGEGIDPDVLARVFDPFFTTKAIGKGTGLGLSQVYGFVRQSGGHVRILSEQGTGTVVQIFLPRLLDESVPLAEAAEAAAPAAAGGAETILLVEDHDALRAYSTGLLTELGYRVLAASHGHAALGILDREPEVALLFTDVMMPNGMDGRQLAAEARRRRPGMRVLFTSGYTPDAVVQDGHLGPGVGLIGKPFTRTALATRVRALLDVKPNPSEWVSVN